MRVYVLTKRFFWIIIGVKLEIVAFLKEHFSKPIKIAFSKLLHLNSISMNLPENDTYSKHRYQINIVECAYEVVQRMKAVKKRPKNQISVEEYAFRLREAINAYKWSIGFDPSASEVSRKQACVISPTHPAFDFWLALHLSIEEADEIPMLLDAYNDDEFGHVENFLGHVQYLVIKIMKSNKLYDFKEQKNAVIEWVREQKEKQKDQKKIKEPQITINIEQLNFIKNVTSIDVHILNQLTLMLQQFNFEQFNKFVNIYQESTNEESEENELENDVQSNTKEPNNDRIPLSLKYPQVLEYFMQLTKHKNNGHIKKKDIENLVKANFEFRDMKASGKKKLLDVNIEKQILNQFIYTFYDGHDYSNYTNKAKMYCQFMIDNFLPFQFDNITTLRKNFSRKSSVHYPFSK